MFIGWTEFVAPLFYSPRRFTHGDLVTHGALARARLEAAIRCAVYGVQTLPDGAPAATVRPNSLTTPLPSTRFGVLSSVLAGHTLSKAVDAQFAFRRLQDLCCDSRASTQHARVIYPELDMPKTIQIRGVPDRLHRKLKTRAAREGMSLSSYVRRELQQIAQRPTMREWLERVSKSKPIRMNKTAAEIIREMRDCG
jgi:plasmid stability protein